jgi:anti-anti-sigma factor
MKIRSKNISSFNLFELNGRLNQDDLIELENQINEKMKYGSKYFVFDISQLSYINSSGLRILIKTQKQLKLFDGYLVLVDPMKNVKELMKLSELEDFLRLRYGLKETIKEFI